MRPVAIHRLDIRDQGCIRESSIFYLLLFYPVADSHFVAGLNLFLAVNQPRIQLLDTLFEL